MRALKIEQGRADENGNAADGLVLRSREEAIRRFRLNERQVKLLDLLAEGVRDKTAADVLGISEGAEHKTVQKLFRKLAPVLTERSRVALAVFWKRKEPSGPAGGGEASSGVEEGEGQSPELRRGKGFKNKPFP